MREFSTPTAYRVPENGNLTDDVLAHLATTPDRVLFRRRRPGDDDWYDITAAQFRDQVVAVAKGLVAGGIAAGDRVGLLSRTRYEWTLLDYAVWWVGAATVPVYDTSPADEVGWVLADSGAVACVVEHEGHRRRVGSVIADLPALRDVWSIDDGGIDTLIALGRTVTDDDLEARRSSVTSHTLATLIYTSGTTGRPKGCRLSHGNFMAELGSATEALDDVFGRKDASTLLFLPLAHVFARVIQVGCVRTGAVLGHTSDVADLVTALGQFRPTFVLSVPRIFEKVYTGLSQQAAVTGRGRAFGNAAATAIAWSRAQADGGPGLALRARHAVFDRLVYARLRSALGGRLRHAVSGGAPLGDRLTHFFRGVGVPVLEGYGLTETTAALTVNRPDEQKVGTVGRPLPGVTARVADDGELWFRGPQVFSGYWVAEGRADAVTGSVLIDGWLRSGDIGEIDGEGFVSVTGRRNEILVTAGGKSVAPAVLEDRVRAHPLVSQCLVVGDGRPFVAALVTVDADAAAGWAEPDLRQVVQSAVDHANRAVSRAESIRRFRLLAEDWTEEGGHLTPSLELRRAHVLRDFRTDIESLYA